MRDVFVGFQINFLAFHTAPQPLDEHVIKPATLAVHTDLNIVVLEHASERVARELASLVGVEYLRYAVLFDGPVQRVNAKARVQRVRHAPGQHTP